MNKLSIRSISLVVLSFLTIAFISCNKEKEELKLDFDITVPENWNSMILANEGWIYTAARNKTSPTDSILESLQIVKESLPNRNLANYYAMIRPAILNSGGHDSIMYESDTVINATNFKKMISWETQMMINSYRDTFDLSVITDRYFFYENEHGYNMVFVSIDTLYRKQNKALFDDIIGTFQYTATK